MLPTTNNNRGGVVGRAMSSAGDRRSIARAGDLQAIWVCVTTITLAGCTLAFGAPHLWSFVLAR